MVENKEKSIAEAMCDDFTSKTKQDRAKCWKPVRSSIKGNTTAITPVLNDLTSKHDIVCFWKKFYMDKLKGLDEPSATVHEKLWELTFRDDDHIEIKKEDVVGAMDDLRTNCSYYDSYTPKLLKLLSSKFAEIFAKLISMFINMTLEDQNEILLSGNHFFRSYIRPIIKGPSLNATAPKSYRPISVSHTLVVLFERVIALEHFKTVLPHNFYGYVKNRSCELAVKTLKDLIPKSRLKTTTLAMLDASAAFESVKWERIFPKLAEMNDSKIIRAIWQMYRFNRNEVRWGNHVSKDYFYSTQGTKQGGVLSGPIFLQYTNFLNERLQLKPGIKHLGRSWNCLGYADDFILIGQSICHLQSLLDVCTEYQAEGYVTWNASKSIIVPLTNNKRKPDPISCFKLNGINLEQRSETKYLGYIVNQNFNDSSMISRQVKRLNCLTNAMVRALPLKLISDTRLRSIIRAYGCVYMLGMLDNYWKYELGDLMKAHRYFTSVVSQYYYRAPDKWDKSKGLFDNSNTSIYARIGIPKFETQIPGIRASFLERYKKYTDSISIL